MSARSLSVLLLSVTVLGFLGCGRKSTVNFRLPEGNAEKGKAAFIALKCHTCHYVHGVELGTAIVVQPPVVTIGGPVVRVKNYGELLTAIINPMHRVSTEMRRNRDQKIMVMPEYNQHMTVEQMIDLVAFLQPRYEQLNPLYYTLSPPSW